jgi:predicted patatin/cPLA2 family phospholipase
MPQLEPRFLLDCGLVLEGGGLRGVYSSGVLRALADLNLEFDYVIGTSMGACNGANFVSRQWDRNRTVNIRFVRDSRYISYLRLLSSGELFGMDFIYRTIPHEIVPFDYQTFYSNPARFVITSTDVESGECVYWEKSALSEEGLMRVMRASTSLPWIGQPVSHEGRKLMDGGLSDSIPLSHAQKAGKEKNLVVLTQPAGYHKSAVSAGGLLRLRHPGLTGLYRCLATRHEQYNRQLKDAEAAEASGRCFVLRPSGPLDVGRIERNPAKLHLLYERGYLETLAAWPKLHDWLYDPVSTCGVQS